MTESTTTAAESPSVALADGPTSQAPAAAPAIAAASPARRWSTLTLALTAAAALVLGLGIGGVGGWVIADAQRPQFGGAFTGGPAPFPHPGDGRAPGSR